MSLTGNVPTPFTVSIVMASAVPVGDDHTVTFFGPEEHSEELLIQSNQTMVFTSANWNTPQLVTVKAQREGTVYLHYRITAPHTARVRTGNIALTITNNQAANIVGGSWGHTCFPPLTYVDGGYVRCEGAEDPAYICQLFWENTVSGGGDYTVSYQVYKDNVFDYDGTANGETGFQLDTSSGVGVYEIYFYLARCLPFGSNPDTYNLDADTLTVWDNVSGSLVVVDTGIISRSSQSLLAEFEHCACP